MSSTTRSLHAAIEAVNGSPRYKATISATTSAASANVSAGTMYLLQTDAAVYVHGGTSGTTVTKADGTTAVLTTGVGYLLEANEKYFLTTRMDETSIVAITGSGSASVKIFAME